MKEMAAVGAVLLTLVGLGVLFLGGQDRVADARKTAEPRVRTRFNRVHLPYPPDRVFLRAFKKERELEVWVAPASGPFRHLATYPIAGMSGKLGPKRREGDLQVPEGFYEIDAFNPRSRFLLSMRVNYPNASDRIRGQKPLGGDIYIHGSNRSIGCLAMTDAAIQEIYLILLDAGDSRRPVHIFPCRMTLPNLATALESQPEHRAFWTELQDGYTAFERTRLVPLVKVRKDGSYAITRSNP